MTVFSLRRSGGCIVLAALLIPFILPVLALLAGLVHTPELLRNSPLAARLPRVIVNTISLAMFSGMTALVLGGLSGVLAGRASPRARLFAVGIFFAVFAVPSHVHAVGLTTLAFLWPRVDAVLYSFGGAVLVLGWLTSPFPFFAAYAAARSWPDEWEDAALLDGGYRRTWIYLWLPLVFRPAFVGACLAAALVFGDFSVPDILFSRDPGKFAVFSTEVQTAAGAFFDLPLASRLGSLFALIPLAAAVFIVVQARRLVDLRPLQAADGGATPSIAWRRFRGGQDPAAVICALVAAFPLAVSLAVPAWMLFRDSGALGIILKSAGDEILFSVLLCGGCALLITLAGAVASGFAADSRFGKTLGLRGVLLLLAGASALLYILPGTLTGVYVAGVFSLSWLRPLNETILPLAVFYLLKGPGAAWPLILYAAMTAPTDVIEAALMDGCGFWRRIRHALAPPCFRFWAAGFALAFLTLLAESAGSVIVSAPGRTPLAVRIQTVMHYGPSGYVSALCLSSALVALSAAVLIMFVLKKIVAYNASNAGGTSVAPS